jgi:hypothetical protein
MSTVSRDDGSEHVSAWRAGLSRRTFLRRGTFTAAAVAVASSVPGMSTVLASSTEDAPALDTGAAGAADDSGALTEPLVAHVKDLNTGEISVFQGEREVVVHSPALARSLMSASRP